VLDWNLEDTRLAIYCEFLQASKTRHLIEYLPLIRDLAVPIGPEVPSIFGFFLKKQIN
jgi:hypothetical protein